MKPVTLRRQKNSHSFTVKCPEELMTVIHKLPLRLTHCSPSQRLAFLPANWKKRRKDTERERERAREQRVCLLCWDKALKVLLARCCHRDAEERKRGCWVKMIQAGCEWKGRRAYRRFCEWSQASAAFCTAIPRDGSRTPNQGRAGWLIQGRLAE